MKRSSKNAAPPPTDPSAQTAGAPETPLPVAPASLGDRARRWRLEQLPKMASDLAAVRRRAAIVGATLVAAMGGLGYRAYEVSVLRHDEYAEQGNRQQLRSYKMKAGRGEVFDRNYLSLAVNDHAYKVVLNPRQIEATGKVLEVAERLHEMFPEVDPEYFADELGRDKAYRRLRMSLTDAQADAVQAWAIPGIRLEQTPERVYPRGLLAAHTLGRVNRQGNGNLGIELGMDRWLQGHETTSPAWYAAAHGQGRKLLVDGSPDPGIARGHSVVLSLDSTVQSMAEEEINTLVDAWHPVGASIVVLDPKTGEVLALANRPTFDPNHRVETITQTNNLAVQAAYEPGSTLKAITVAAALEEGAIRPDQTFFCEEGRYEYTTDHPIRDTKPSEWLSVTECLALSSNICTTKIYEELGKQSLYRWVRRFHFGERPAIQLPGASKGLLDDWREWPMIQGANISFGQGMSASPLQVAAAFGALANDGEYNEPTLVLEVIANDGETVWKHEPRRERVVRADTARTVMEMLTAVVHTRKGTGKNARIDGYKVAGKTSTAQKANPAGGYFEHQYYASFVGAVPADDPRVVILVSVDNPEGGHYGNEVAAPTFARLGERLMTYYGVPREDGSVPVPERIALESDDPKMSEGFLAELDVTPHLPGEGPVKFTTGLPDFTGLTLSQAVQQAEKADVVLVASGSGIAVGQSVPPGPVDSGTEVKVHFEPTY